MHDASLNRHLGEDGFRPFLQARHAVHGQEQNILSPAFFQLVKNLHPVMVTLRFVQPET